MSQSRPTEAVDSSCGHFIIESTARPATQKIDLTRLARVAMHAFVSTFSPPLPHPLDRAGGRGGGRFRARLSPLPCVHSVQTASWAGQRLDPRLIAQPSKPNEQP